MFSNKLTESSSRLQQKILATDKIPLFYGSGDDNKVFIGWVFRDALGNEIAAIENIWYEADEVYRNTDGHAGCAYKCLLSTGEVIWFRHINSLFKELGAFELDGGGDGGENC
jgi:hypothetical protein